MNEISANQHYTPLYEGFSTPWANWCGKAKSAPTGYRRIPAGHAAPFNRPTKAHLRSPRIASVQNPYNLLNRSYEVGMAEISLRENAPLLAYPPLAFGVLSGKYRHGQKPEGARLTPFERFQRYSKPKAAEAVERYAAIAEAAGLSLATLSLAFVNQRAFVAANIIGATTMAQLRENIASADVVLGRRHPGRHRCRARRNEQPVPLI